MTKDFERCEVCESPEPVTCAECGKAMRQSTDGDAREAFEAWVESFWGKPERKSTKSTIKYKDGGVDAYWRAWQAAWKARGEL